MPKYAVIVVGAGQSSRFGGEENKVLAVVDGQPLFVRALQLFVNRPDVCHLLFVAAPGDVETMRTKYAPNLAFMDVTLVEGGKERHDSVAAGLAAVKPEAEYVAIHDCARPCVVQEWIDAVFAEAVKSGAAVPATRVTATVKSVGPQGFIEKTVPREGLWLAQTPQVFRRDVIEAAYKQRKPSDPPPTDDAALVEASGFAVKVIESDPRNIKITTKGDLSLANAIIKSLPQPKRGGPLGAFEEAKW